MSADLVQFKVTTLFARDRGFKLWAMFYTVPDSPVLRQHSYELPFTHIKDLGTISVTRRNCASPVSKVERHISDRFCSTLWYNCLVPRRLSLDENVREKEGGKERTGETSVPFPWSLAVHHQSLAFHARLYDAKNEASEEEAAPSWCSMFVNDSQSVPLLRFILDWTVFLVGTKTYPV